MMAKAKIKTKTLTPLKLIMIWHPDFINGRKYADALFRTFSRDEFDFSAGHIGIPVNYLTTPIDNALIEHYASNSERVAFILLVDAKMVLHDEWKAFVANLAKFCTRDNRVIYPIAAGSLSAAVNIGSCIATKNFIQLQPISEFATDEKKFADRAKYLCSELAHELCRFLFNRERICDTIQSAQAPSIKVFLSQARIGGVPDPVAIKLNEYISSKTSLKTFIDVNDIHKGDDFEEVIEENIADSILVAIHSDRYSSREWCQRELLFAKRHGCPILVLDALSDCEVRRFPYGANMKVIHLGHDDLNGDRCKQIVYEILLETLKIKYMAQFLNYILSLYASNNEDVDVYNYPPELYTLLMQSDDNKKLILYPEPPLNVNELKILKEYKPASTFVTPTLMPFRDTMMGKMLEGVNIGLSISEVGMIGENAHTDLHLTTFYIELCRYLLAADANLIYTGNVNYKAGINFVEELRQLINNYCFNSKKEKRISIYYLSEPQITDEIKAEMLPCFKFVQVASNAAKSEDERMKNDLTSMRMKADANVFARIVIGGKTKDYKGRYPGIVEEAFISIKNGKPIFVVGAYGGAAEQIAKALRGEKTLDSAIETEFSKRGFINLNNGLSKEENLELAFGDDVVRNISLILKGLKNIILKQGGENG